MRAKHTPGPWSINHWTRGIQGVTCHGEEQGITYFSGDAVRNRYFGIRSRLRDYQHTVHASFEGAHICDIKEPWSQDSFHREAAANARLIAAAPEMLEVLQEFIQAFDSGDVDYPIRDRAELVIKKATL